MLLNVASVGALRRATSTPLRYATNPSSYFTRSASEASVVGSDTVNGIRRYADALTLCIDALISLPISPEKAGAANSNVPAL